MNNPKLIDEYPVTHQFGTLEVMNTESIELQNVQEVDFGVQIANDGRVWICINGITILRFKPK
jgi:hypothetical protein